MNKHSLLPCPHCNGRAVVFIGKALEDGAAPTLSDYGCDGLDISAHVFCHDCGAQGPCYEELIFTRADYAQAQDQAAALWNKRPDAEDDTRRLQWIVDRGYLALAQAWRTHSGRQSTGLTNLREAIDAHRLPKGGAQ